jgi:DNA-binding response OmpR family regulator
MVVDDEPAIGKLLVYQLRSFGYQASYVADGLLALRRFALEQPDLVLLDVMMPQISGWEICRQIRACSTAPVIMLTAKAAEGDVVAGLSAGADDYITKPFSMAQLQARIEAVLRRSLVVPGLQPPARQPARRDPHLLAPAEAAEYVEPPRPTPKPASEISWDARTPRLGQRLREARQDRNLTLHQVERDCKIRWEFLQAIEQDNFSYLPRQELRRALKSYAAYLDVDLRDAHGRSYAVAAPLSRQQHLAILMTLMVVLIAVGLYLL